MSVPFDSVGPAGVIANIEYYTALEQDFLAQAQAAKQQRRQWKKQLAVAQRLARKAETEAQPKRRRGRPFKQWVLSAEERQQRHRLHNEAKQLSTKQVEVICLLKKK